MATKRREWRDYSQAERRAIANSLEAAAAFQRENPSLYAEIVAADEANAGQTLIDRANADASEMHGTGPLARWATEINPHDKPDTDL